VASLSWATKGTWAALDDRASATAMPADAAARRRHGQPGWQREPSPMARPIPSFPVRPLGSKRQAIKSCAARRSGAAAQRQVTGLVIRWLMDERRDGVYCMNGGYYSTETVMVFLRAMAAFLGGGRLGQPRRPCSPRRRARRVPTCRKRRLHGREADRKRTERSCPRNRAREDGLDGRVGWCGLVPWT
jgi:hypothetical protein